MRFQSSTCPNPTISVQKNFSRVNELEEHTWPARSRQSPPQPAPPLGTSALLLSQASQAAQVEKHVYSVDIMTKLLTESLLIIQN